MKFFNYDPGTQISAQVSERISKVISEGQFIGGAEVSLFEANFAGFTDCSEVVTCGNGLDALALALSDLELPQGSKIAVSGHTFFATWLAILNAGFVPVGVDADLSNLQMSPDALSEVLSRNEIRAVIYVHMHGILGAIREVVDLCAKYDLPLIEDCAQAHGLRVEGKHVGSLGDYGAFSFYPTKNLPALGDAGAVIASKRSMRLVRSRANYGWMPGDRDKHEILGVNSRLDTLQAGILNVHLEHLNSFNSLRSSVAHRYNEAIRGAANPEKVQILPSGIASVWHHYPVRVRDREDFVAFMASKGVPTQIHYPTPCHKHPAYLNTVSPEQMDISLPNVEEISRTIVSLPMHPWLKDHEVELVVGALSEWMAKE